MNPYEIANRKQNLLKEITYSFGHKLSINYYPDNWYDVTIYTDEQEYNFLSIDACLKEFSIDFLNDLLRNIEEYGDATTIDDVKFLIEYDMFSKDFEIRLYNRLIEILTARSVENFEFEKDILVELYNIIQLKKGLVTI